MIKKTIFGLLTIVLATFTYSEACIMVPLSLEQVRDAHEYVLAGTVTSVQVAQKEGESKDMHSVMHFLNTPDVYYTFTIDKVIKGDITSSEIIIPKNTTIACGTSLRSGGIFILYINKGKDDHYYYSSSQRQHLLNNINEVSKYSIKKLGGPSRLQRVLQRFDRFL